MPIQPETHGIQTVKLQAVNSTIAGSNLPNSGGFIFSNGAASTEVFVNAKDMLDVTNISSDHSDANLTIQNLTTLDSNGNVHALSIDRIGMAFTGNSDSGWKESDMHVYFDQDYLIPNVTSEASVDIQLMNQAAYDVDPTHIQALGLASDTGAYQSTFISQLSIKLNGTTYDLTAYLDKGYSALNTLHTYQDELAAIQAAIVHLKADNLKDAVLQTLSAKLGATFLADIPASVLPGGDTGPRVGTSVTLSVNGGGSANTLSVETLLLSPVGQNTPDMNLFNAVEDTPTIVSTNLAINVDLTKVGNGGDGGSLVIGSMYKNGLNVWSDQYAGKGINEFDVVVHGTKVLNGDDQSSSLKQLASTGNNLEIVKVVSDPSLTKNFADLTIGNSQTEDAYGILNSQITYSHYYDNYHYSNALVAGSTTVTAANSNALKDVQIFDASQFKGDLTLFAALTSEVTAKYLNVVDGSPAAPAADNEHFAYTGGSGNDYINLSLSADNLAQPGTVTREDFTLTVDGGAGNDVIVVEIDTAAFEPVHANSYGKVNTNWYQNQHYVTADLELVKGVATGQLEINGGDGNDTIRKLGAGDFAINTGNGNDTVYADNTGTDYSRSQNSTGGQFNDGRGVAVFNALQSDSISDDQNHLRYNVNNLLSQSPHSLDFAANVHSTLTVNVEFRGFANSVDITSIVDSSKAAGHETITDLMINQAIKTAVNGDPVLSKLAIVEDGPGDTLIMRSLIDGDLGIDPSDSGNHHGDYHISLTPGAVVAGVHTISLQDLHDAFGTDVSTGMYTNEGPQDKNGNYLEGANSHAPSDNLIAVGFGHDVIVLGTAGYLDHANSDLGTDAASTALENELIGSNDKVAFSGFNSATAVRDTSIVNFDTTNDDGVIGQGFDKLDFSSYSVKAVVVTDTGGINGGVGIALPGVASAYNYLVMTESTTHDGQYNVTVMHHAAAAAVTTDTLVGTVGTLDFGHQTAFIAANFII